MKTNKVDRYQFSKGALAAAGSVPFKGVSMRTSDCRFDKDQMPAGTVPRRLLFCI